MSCVCSTHRKPCFGAAVRVLPPQSPHTHTHVIHQLGRLGGRVHRQHTHRIQTYARQLQTSYSNSQVEPPGVLEPNSDNKLCTCAQTAYLFCWAWSSSRCTHSLHQHCTSAGITGNTHADSARSAEAMPRRAWQQSSSSTAAVVLVLLWPPAAHIKELSTRKEESAVPTKPKHFRRQESWGSKVCPRNNN